MDNVTIGFGRNVAAPEFAKDWAPATLSPERWTQFQSDVYVETVAAGGDVHFRGTGDGTWDGVSEEAACVVFFAGPDFRWSSYREALGRIARRYSQDAIAITGGESDLVRPGDYI